jgi:ankyrin repeat protein
MKRQLVDNNVSSSPSSSLSKLPNNQQQGMKRPKQKFIKGTKENNLLLAEQLIDNTIDEIDNEDNNDLPDEIVAFQYAETGKCNHLLNMLKKKPELLNKFSSSKGELPLITCASYNGKIETLKMLIKQGCDINIKSGPFGLTPIQFAAMNSHLIIIKELISSGADVNLTSDDGITGENNGLNVYLSIYLWI